MPPTDEEKVTTTVRVALFDGREVDLDVDRVEWSRELSRAREEGDVVAVRDRAGEVLSIDPDEIACELVGAAEIEAKMRHHGIAHRTGDDSETAPPTTRESLGYLRGALGETIAAFLLGFDDVDHLVRLCEDAEPALAEPARRRLSEAEEVARMIVERFDSDTARAWLFGMNGYLDDKAPADVIRTAGDDAQLAEVRAAAMKMISG